MKKAIQRLLIFLVLWVGVIGKAQVYPVQVTPVFNTPYSSSISDYATSMDIKMRLLIHTTDLAITNRQVRFKMYVQGNGINAQSTDFVTGMNPIYLNGGELVTLTNLDLAPLFRLENLAGISPQDYANPLPEGMYNVCFEVYDVLSNQRISQKSCASLYLMLNDPPLLNTPVRNESIAVKEFPNILFTWTPRQINATNVSYKYELKEILDATIDPQIGFLTAPLLYEEETRGTALLYDISKPNLLSGKRYAWRVKAISTSGLSVNNVFKNEGYSEIYHFTYASNCPAPSFVLSEALSARSVRVSWLGDHTHTKYHVQYRKANVAGAEWFEVYTMNTQTTLSDLEAGATYEFRVGGSCEPAVLGNMASFTYSGINTFTMQSTRGTANSNFTCGLKPSITIANQTPITNLIINETFTAGDFPVKILELSGGNGNYSGKGYVIVPYLADTKIAVEFTNITINTSYQLIKGVVETSYNPDWVNVLDIEDYFPEVDIFNDANNETVEANNPINQVEQNTIGGTETNDNTPANTPVTPVTPLPNPSPVVTTPTNVDPTANPIITNPTTPTSPTAPTKPENPIANTSSNDTKDDFKSLMLTATDSKNKSRIAKEGETLYYIDKFKPTNIELTIDPKKLKNKNDVTWFSNSTAMPNENGVLKFRTKVTDVYGTVREVTIKSLAGNPDKVKREVDLKWVKEGYVKNTFSFTSGNFKNPLIKKAFEATKMVKNATEFLDKIPFVKRVQNKGLLKSGEINYFYNITPFQEEFKRVEDTSTRLYYEETVTSGGFELGIEGKATVWKWGIPFDELPLPRWTIDKIKKYITAEVSIVASASSSGEMKAINEERLYVESSIRKTIKNGVDPAILKLDIAFGVESEFSVGGDNDYISGGINASGITKAELFRIGYYDEIKDFRSVLLKDGVYLELKASGYINTLGKKWETERYYKKIELIKGD